MRILYICHRFPFPPKRGGKIRPFNMIRHLNQNHEVVVASLVRSDEEAAEIGGIAEFCSEYHYARVSSPAAVINMVTRLPSATPSSMGYFYSPHLKRMIDKVLATQNIDLIFVHCSSVAQYVEGVTGIPKILDFGDIDSQKWLEYSRVKQFPLTLGYWLEGRKLQAAEVKLARKFDYCTCTTKAELETLQGFGVDVATDWFPNGVDFEYFNPSEDVYERNTICFVGRMDYYPNQECMQRFCAEIMPLLREQIPAIKLLIVGADPSPAILALQKLPGVEVTGSVPDVRPYLRKSTLTVAPLSIARGTQNKILESLAMGVPVISSPQAAGGIDAVAGEHFLVAESPEDYVAKICKLVIDDEYRKKFSLAGRNRMLSNHSWSSSMERMVSVIDECISATEEERTGDCEGKQKVELRKCS